MELSRWESSEIDCVDVSVLKLGPGANSPSSSARSLFATLEQARRFHSIRPGRECRRRTAPGIESTCETPEIYEHEVQFNRAHAAASVVLGEPEPWRRLLSGTLPESAVAAVDLDIPRVEKQPTERLRLSGGSASFILNAVTRA